MRRKSCCIVFLLASSHFLLAGDEDGLAEDPPLLTAWEAHTKAQVSIGARVLGSHRSVTLTLSNKTQRDVAVDVCGAILAPHGPGNHQRLALGPAETGKSRGAGTSVVVLSPNKRINVRVGAIGLDPGRPLPVFSVMYRLAGTELEPRLAGLLRWWADHPTCEQWVVEDAVRKGLDRVPIEEAKLPLPGEPAGRFALSCSGVYYTLLRGELCSVDASGASKVLADGVHRAFPLPGCIYAIRAGESRPLGLEALGITGEGGWEPLEGLSIEDPGEILRLAPGPDGRLLVFTREHLRLWSRKDGGQAVEFGVEDRLGVTTCVEPTGRVLIAVNNGRCELWEIPPRGKQARLVRHFPDILCVAAGPAGVYGLYNSGSLRRYRRNGLEKMPAPDRYAAILFVGRKGLWLAGEDGEIVYADALSGRPKLRSGVKMETVISLDVDPETDDLAFTRADGFCRMRPAGDGVEVIRGFED